MAAASITLELTQYALAVGSSDLTDVLVNTVGGKAGLGLCTLARRWLRHRTVPVLTRACAVGTALGVLAGAIIVATPLNYGLPRDFQCNPPHSASCTPPGDPGRR